MSLRLEPQSSAWDEEVRRFNERMRAGGWGSFLLGESPTAEDVPEESAPVTRRGYLALDADDAVRGGVDLVHLPLRVADETLDGANLQAPLSEGVVNKAFAAVAPAMLKKILRITPAIYAVGMGGPEQPLPRLLRGLGWEVTSVPFLFRVHRSGPFLGRLPRIRERTALRVAADLARYTGLGRLGFPAFFRRRGRFDPVALDPVTAWGDWADEIWARASGPLGFAAVRSAATLPFMHPTGSRLLLRRASVGSETVGWLALLDTTLDGHPHFGGLRVGTILDGLAIPGREADLVVAADELLGQRGVDMTLSNQLHPAWVAGLLSAGFRSGPSNYLIAISREIVKRLAASRPDAPRHVTRGDGDGRIHL